jgi:hypothetical protein
MAYKAFVEWMGNASDQNQYEYILSIDKDDAQIDCYKSQFKETGIKLLINENRSMIDAVNNAAKLSTGDCLIVVSDDFGCPKDWDVEIKNTSGRLSGLVTTHLNEPAENFAIMIDDCINGNQSGCMTLPIISRGIYEKLGHIYNPRYFSMFADNELHDVCKKNGWLIYSDLKFEHRHFINGKNPKDHTYNRENSQSAWDLGKKIYEQRKAKDFV